MREQCKLSLSDLRCVCDAKQFQFKNTSQIKPLEDVIGQKRAVQSIDFGLNMQSPGYNIFVTGLEGTGKSTIIQDIVAEFALPRSTPVEWCMVNNFDDEFRPIALSLPAGQVGEFKKQMLQFVDNLRRELPEAFGSKSYQERMTKIQQKYGNRQRELFERIDAMAAEKGLAVNRTQSGLQTFPTVEGQPMSREQFAALPKGDQDRIQENIRQIQIALDDALRAVGQIKQEMQDATNSIMAEVTLFVVRARIEVIKSKFNQCPDVRRYLEKVLDHIVANPGDFMPPAEGPKLPEGFAMASPKSAFQKYQVNVLIDRRDQKGAPVVFETNPTYQNVFGNIEKRAYMGTLTTDFTMVQAGSLLRANGGYLILEVESVLMNPLVWNALKRALLTKKLFIEDMTTSMGITTTSLRPEPIPLDVKVILIGNYELFHMLQNHDAKFNKIFKVRADFDYEVRRTDETLEQYAQFIARVCKTEKLMPVTASGVAAMVEYAEKQVADKNKLSLQFGRVAAMLKEADYWARKAGGKSVAEKHVVQAIREYRFRYNLYEQKTHDRYAENTILLDVDGSQVGQVNALAVYQLGEIAFGRPSRITAETFMGKPGVINIERESKLSGKTHDKGVMILSGFLGRTFAQRYPLNLSISITFEQSYGGIDGDSASSTELYAILSSLSQFPIQQGIAVTGSVNQKGQIQAIGGVNEKVEGFFEVCRTKGLTGSQGVMIPSSNVKNLMLSREVIKAVRAGKFHIYAVSSVQEGIEILTGVAAGTPDDQGRFAPGTVFGEVQKQLKTYLARSYRLKKEFGPAEDEEE